MMSHSHLQSVGVLLGLCLLNLKVQGFQSNRSILKRVSVWKATKDSWSAADDWLSLSSENSENSSFDSSKLFNQDQSIHAALEMESGMENSKPSKEDIWIADAIDEIHNSFSTLDETPLYDTSFEESSIPKSMDDTMDQEIAMLVRCNENPDELLVHEGRAVAPLTEAELKDPFQLVVYETKAFKSTKFFKDSVSAIFKEHCRPGSKDGIPSLNRECKCFGLFVC